jgi:pyruvate kinase
VVANANAILRDAEVGIDSQANFNYLRNWTAKPMPTLEAICSSAVKSAIDMDAALVCIITNTLAPVRAVVKYRPHQSVVVATTKLHVAQQANICYGTVPLLLNRLGGVGALGAQVTAILAGATADTCVLPVTSLLCSCSTKLNLGQIRDRVSACVQAGRQAGGS